MDKLSTTLVKLSSPEVVLGSAFLIGFLPVILKGRTIYKRPLSSLFDASISGFFCYLGGCVVTLIMPRGLHFLIPVACGASSLYFTAAHVVDLTRPQDKND